MSLAACKLIDFPEINTHVGSLCFAECGCHIPFEVRRVYYLYNMPGDVTRGYHAHSRLNQVLIAVTGSMDILLDDGNDKQTFHLDSPSKGLCVGPMVWRELSNFSDGAICLSLASDLYDESDYIRDYDQFVSTVRVSQG